MKWLKGLLERSKKWLKGLLDQIRGNHIMRNRKITTVKFLNYYVIFGAISGLCYFVVALIYDLPKHWSFTPLYLLALAIFAYYGKRNATIIRLYITDMEQGKLLLYLNDHTHWSNDHKLKVIKWVYLRNNKTRQETKLKVLEKIKQGQEITKTEAMSVKSTAMFCPQQILDGFNKALLVSCLIHAHRFIQALDPEIREIMELTPEHILSFNLHTEAEKCKNEKYQKLMEKGKKISKKLNKK